MKIYKYITLFLIALLCVYCGIECLNTLSPDADLIFGMSLCCFGLVLVADMKDRKKAKKHAKN